MVFIECFIAILYYCKDRYGYFEWNWEWLLAVIIPNIFLFWITIYAGAAIGVGIRWAYYNLTDKESRKFIRNEYDHPLVKQLKKDGYS